MQDQGLKQGAGKLRSAFYRIKTRSVFRNISAQPKYFTDAKR
jgi:hypothetical protein